MANSKSILLCQHCGWKRVCDPDAPGLLELKNDSMSSRKFRCPGCGRAIAPRKHPDPQSEVDRKIKDARMKEENEAFIKSAIDFSANFAKESEDANE
jgi:hypothetical protein